MSLIKFDELVEMATFDPTREFFDNTWKKGLGVMRKRPCIFAAVARNIIILSTYSLDEFTSLQYPYKYFQINVCEREYKCKGDTYVLSL